MLLRNGKITSDKKPTKINYKSNDKKYKSKYKKKITIDIDFDYASKMWRKNKNHLGYGVFEYK